MAFRGVDFFIDFGNLETAFRERWNEEIIKFASSCADLVFLSSVICAAIFSTIFVLCQSFPLIVSAVDHRFINHSVASCASFISVFVGGAIFPIFAVSIIRWINNKTKNKSRNWLRRFQFHFHNVGLVFVSLSVLCTIAVEEYFNVSNILVRAVCIILPTVFCVGRLDCCFYSCILLSRFIILDLDARESVDFFLGIVFGVDLVFRNISTGLICVWVALSALSFEVLDRIQIVFHPNVFPMALELWQEIMFLLMCFSVILVVISLTRLFFFGLIKREVNALATFASGQECQVGLS